MVNGECTRYNRHIWPVGGPPCSQQIIGCGCWTKTTWGPDKKPTSMPNDNYWHPSSMYTMMWTFRGVPWWTPWCIPSCHHAYNESGLYIMLPQKQRFTGQEIGTHLPVDGSLHIPWHRSHNYGWYSPTIRQLTRSIHWQENSVASPFMWRLDISILSVPRDDHPYWWYNNNHKDWPTLVFGQVVLAIPCILVGNSRAYWLVGSYFGPLHQSCCGWSHIVCWIKPPHIRCTAGTVLWVRKPGTDGAQPMSINNSSFDSICWRSIRQSYASESWLL